MDWDGVEFRSGEVKSVTAEEAIEFCLVIETPYCPFLSVLKLKEPALGRSGGRPHAGETGSRNVSM